MKHAKRMALVPEEMLDRFERRRKLETSPIVSDLLQSDIRLSDILERPDLGDDERQKLYNASMERYLELRQQKDSQVPTVRFAPAKEEEKKQLEPVIRSYCSGTHTQDNAPESHCTFRPVKIKT